MDGTYFIGPLIGYGILIIIIKLFKLDDKLNEFIENIEKKKLEINNKRKLEEGLVDTPVPSNNWKWKLVVCIVIASLSCTIDLLTQLLILGRYIPPRWEAIIANNGGIVACLPVCNLRREWKEDMMKFAACKATVEVLFRVVSEYQIIPFILGQFSKG